MQASSRKPVVEVRDAASVRTANYAAMFAVCSSARCLTVLFRGGAVQITFIDEYNCNFILSNTDASIANALRKSIISEVPTIAIDLVEVEESGSPTCTASSVLQLICLMQTHSHVCFLRGFSSTSLILRTPHYHSSVSVFCISCADSSCLADEFIAHRLGLIPLISARAIVDGPCAYRCVYVSQVISVSHHWVAARIIWNSTRRDI